MTTDNPFRLFWSLGFRRLCPITPPGCPVSDRSSFARRIAAGDDARGKAPGVRWPDGAWSGFDFVQHESVETDLDRWHAMGAGVGIKTGRGVVGIDIDTPDRALVTLILAAALRHFGVLPKRIGNDPKCLLVVRTDEDFQYARVEFGERDAKGRLQDRVEILAEGRQFVAHGVHPKTRKPYHWPDGLPALESIPYASTTALLAFLEALRPILPAASDLRREGAAGPVDQRSLQADPAVLADVIAKTPNTSAHFPTRESYRDFGYAIKGAFGPAHEREAFDAFADWCARWTDGTNEPDVVAADWARMKAPCRVGAGKVFETAELASGGAVTAAMRWFDPSPPQTEAPLFPEAKTDARRFVFTPFREAADTALQSAAKPLIKGVLDQGAMTVLYGESNAGKTFVAMDIAYHISQGRPWGGKRAAALPVLYVAAEGGGGARKRAAALASRYGYSDAFYFLLSTVNLLRPDADLQPLIASIADLAAGAGKFGLIVIDTLSRAMAGGDENASTDMGAMVRHLDVLRASTGAHLMTVHHSGKDRAKGARGHSLLRAATDTEIEVADGEIAVTKQRDLDGGFSTKFELNVFTLGVDADGDPVTSCTVKLLSAEEAAAQSRTRGLTVAESKVLDALRSLGGAGSHTHGVSVADIHGFFFARSDNMSAEAVRHNLRALLAKGVAERKNRGLWVAKAAETASAESIPPHSANRHPAKSGEENGEEIFG